MSISGSGKFRPIYVEDFDRHSSFSSSGRSGVYNPQVASASNFGHGVNFEPGTGAEYMYQKGWSNRDAYGKPLPSTITNVNRNVKFDNDDDDNLFSKKNRSKLILLILLAIVSLLLLALVIVIIVLFATGVFTTKQAQSSDIIIPIMPSTTIPPGADIIVNRTFELQIYIVDQANDNFDNINSYEYQQALLLLQNSLTNMVQQSTLRDLQPSINIVSLSNEQTDLKVIFQISIRVPSRSPILAPAIRNLFLSEIRLLENQLNGSEVDRGRISVRIIQQ